MANLAGIAGSLRKHSYNRTLLGTAAGVLPEGSGMSILVIDDVPLYNADIESEGMPESVLRLRAQIRAADGLVIATPEYNGGVPGVLKNAIDWLSRPVEGESSVFNGKPLAVMGATPGGFGTALSQAAWLPVFRTLRLSLWTGGGNYLLSRAAAEFADGKLSDARREALRKYMAGFVNFVEQRQQ